MALGDGVAVCDPVEVWLLVVLDDGVAVCEPVVLDVRDVLAGAVMLGVGERVGDRIKGP